MTEIPKGDIFGQYPSDHALYPNDPRLDQDPHDVKEARGDGNPTLHIPESGSLFDESVQVPDEATGEVPGAADRDPLQHLREGGLAIVGDHELGGDGRSSRGTDGVDLAEAWLMEHDPDYPKKRLWH